MAASMPPTMNSSVTPSTTNTVAEGLKAVLHDMVDRLVAIDDSDRQQPLLLSSISLLAASMSLESVSRQLASEPRSAPSEHENRQIW